MMGALARSSLNAEGRDRNALRRVGAFDEVQREGRAVLRPGSCQTPETGADVLMAEELLAAEHQTVGR